MQKFCKRCGDKLWFYEGPTLCLKCEVLPAQQLALNLDAKSPRELNSLSDELWMIREQNRINEQSKSREKLIQLQTLEEE